MSLYREYRPSCWEELVGHGSVKRSIERMKMTGSLGGRAFWISGLSGTGKTTIAYLIAGEVCDPDNFIEIDAGDATEAELDRIEKLLRHRCLGAVSGRAVLINEAHGLRAASIRKLLVILERIPKHATWIFTTTNEGQARLFDKEDSHPLLSRCIPFSLQAPRKPDAYAAYIQRIAEAEDLGGASTAEYELLVRECRFNLRECLCRIEAGQMYREPVVV